MGKKIFSTVVQSLFAVAFVVGCSSTKVTDKLEEEYKSGTGDKSEKVGIKDDKIVIQKRIYLEEQLQVLNAEIEDLQLSTYGKSRRSPGGTWDALRRCRKRLADPRIGGTGNPAPMEKWENIAKKDKDFEYTVNKNKDVVAVSEEGLTERIGRLKKTKRVLTQKNERFGEKLDTCESDYRTALVQHGLNPDDTKAQGEWVQGPNGYRIWKMKRTKTTDPEELMRRKAKREKKKNE